MAGLIFAETDATPICGTVANCSPYVARSIASADREISVGGALGSTAVTITISASATEWAVLFESAASQPKMVNWRGGTWTVRLNVTSANKNLQWRDTYICRMASGCSSLSTVGSLLAQTTALGAVGAKVHTVSGVVTAGDMADRIYIVLAFKNTAASNQSMQFTPDQLIDSPLKRRVFIT